MTGRGGGVPGESERAHRTLRAGTGSLGRGGAGDLTVHPARLSRPLSQFVVVTVELNDMPPCAAIFGPNHRFSIW
jgi:hypothetical protein